MDNRRYVQAQEFKLAATISASDTTITLQTFDTPDGSDITSAMLGTENYATLEANTSREEIIKFAGSNITQNADNTATITSVTRGLKFSSGDAAADYGAGSGLGQAHTAGSKMILTNNPQLYDSFTNKKNDESIAGTWTFSAVPASSAAPVSGNDLANKTYVDDNVNGGAVSMDQLIVAGDAGETVAAGEVVYFDDTANEWKLADASAAATTDNVMMGIAQGAGTDGAAISGGVLLRGIDTNQTGLTIGAPYYLSDTAGALSASTGTVERILGFAKAATDFYFDPYHNDHPSAKEKDALTKLVASTHSYAADAEASDTYVITLSPAPTAYTEGMVVRFKANTANTGAATINVNALGAKSIVKHKGATLFDNDIQAGAIVELVYDGTNFQLQTDTRKKIEFISAGMMRTGTNTTFTNDASYMGVVSFTDGVTGDAYGTVTVPPGCTSVSAVEYLYRREVTSGVVYLGCSWVVVDMSSLPDDVTTPEDNHSATTPTYTSSGNDSSLDVFTAPTTSHDGLSFVEGDILGFKVTRQGGNAGDTYNKTFELFGVRITFA